MRLSIAIILSSIILSSCSTPYTDIPMTIEEAWRITESFDYQKDPPAGYWKSPSEFESDGGGDCEDFTTYFLYLLGPDSGAKMAVIFLTGRGFHAVAQLPDGRLIEPQCHNAYWNATVLWTLSYDAVMAFAGASSKALDESGEMVDNGIIREMVAECE